MVVLPSVGGRAGDWMARPITSSMPDSGDARYQSQRTTGYRRLRGSLAREIPEVLRRRLRCSPLAEVANPRDLFADILRRIDRLRPAPLPT